MVNHVWSNYTDWQYCQLENVRILNDALILKSDNPGIIISDIRDSSSRLHHYGEIIYKLSTFLNTYAKLYIRSGWNPEYNADSWTDWKLIDEPEQRMEYTLSLTSNKIIVDYDIKSIANIYFINNAKYQLLAMNLDAMYLTPLTDADANNELYSYLWSGLIDDAIVDFAKVDQNGEPLTQYATGATFANNVITLTNSLPDDNSIVIVRYTPRHFIYSDSKCRYIQFKIELFSTDKNNVDPVVLLVTRDGKYFITKDDKYIDVHTMNPEASSITIKYHLDFQSELEDIFPKFFRRL